MADQPVLLYVGARLPVRSETFVYREIFGLRDRGWTVHAASLRKPPSDLGGQALEQLAAEMITVYEHGFWRRGLIQALRHPLVYLTGLTHALLATDVKWHKRPAIIAQVLGGLALAYRVRRLGISHIHAHMAHAPAGVAMYAAMALGVPFSFTGHAADLFRDRQLLKAKLRRCKFVACISRWHRDFYRQIIDMPTRKLPIIRCGVNVTVFSPDHHPRGHQLFAVGRLVEKKGFDTLLRAVALLNCPFHLTLAGDGEEREKLESLIRELGLQDRVQMIGDTDNDRVRDLMKQADIFILPCRATRSGDRDGIPVVLMEAMACGVPVISGDLVTIRELIDHDRTGLLVPPDDAEQLARAIERVLEDSDFASSLADAGRRWVDSEFAMTVNLKRLEDSLLV